MQTSVRTAITVSTGVIAGRHLAVLLVILLCFLAARADVCENRYYSEYWCDRWASFGCSSCHIVMFSCSSCRRL